VYGRHVSMFRGRTGQDFCGIGPGEAGARDAGPGMEGVRSAASGRAETRGAGAAGCLIATGGM